MQHVFDTDKPDSCLVCGATQAEIEDNIATVECLGPAGYQLRKAALVPSEPDTKNKCQSLTVIAPDNWKLTWINANTCIATETPVFRIDCTQLNKIRSYDWLKS